MESCFVCVVRPGKRVYRIFRGSFLFGKRVRADSAFADLALKGGKVALGVVESRGKVVLVGGEDVMLLVILLVCQLYGGGRRLVLCGLDAPLDVVEGPPKHFPFGGGGDGVLERGERTHERRWGGNRGGDRGARALVPGAVESGMSGRPEEKWGRGRDRRRICSGRGLGRGGLLRRDCVLGWEGHGRYPFLGPHAVCSRRRGRRGRRGGFAGRVRIWDGIGRATVIFVHIF